MEDILSQAEIDALLSAISTGEVRPEEIKEDRAQKTVKVFDFRRPSKFSKDHLRTLEMLHESFARLLSTYLSTSLRAVADVALVSADQLTYDEFIRSVPNPTLISILRMDPLDGNVIFEINLNLVFAIIDRLLGGPGQITAKVRELTEIEESLIKTVISRALFNLQEAWKSMLEVEFQILDLETNPQFAQIAPPNDMVVLITFEAKVAETSGMISICIPYSVLEPNIGKFSAQQWFSGVRRAAHSESKTIQKELEKIKVDLSAQLGDVCLSLQDLVDLRKGDVIRLDMPLSRDLRVLVGGKQAFFAHPGSVGKRVAVQITRPLRAGEGESDE